MFERAARNRAGRHDGRRPDRPLQARLIRPGGQAVAPAGGTKEFMVQCRAWNRQGAGARRERTWDVLMLNARRQAEDYAPALPARMAGRRSSSSATSATVRDLCRLLRPGKELRPVPRPAVFPHLPGRPAPPRNPRAAGAIWRPDALDPARKAARVTRAIAERLAAVSKALEEQKHPPKEVAMFLMRCLFTMFAEDGLCCRKLQGSAAAVRTGLLRFAHGRSTVGGDGHWRLRHALEAKVARFNGEFFRSGPLPLGREEIGDLRRPRPRLA